MSSSRQSVPLGAKCRARRASLLRRLGGRPWGGELVLSSHTCTGPEPRKETKRQFHNVGPPAPFLRAAARLAVLWRALACRAQIDPACSDIGQLLVGGLFLSQRLLQQASGVIAAKLLGPGD